MPNKHRGRSSQDNPAVRQREEGVALARHQPIFGPLAAHASITRHEPRHGWALVTSRGELHLHQQRRGEPEEWAYVVAHCLLHLGLGHFQQSQHRRELEWNIACDCIIAKFLADLKFGKPPPELDGLVLELSSLPGYRLHTEEQLYEDLCERGIPENLLNSGTAGPDRDMLRVETPLPASVKLPDWPALLSQGLLQAVHQAVDIAGGAETPANSELPPAQQSEAQRARAWFINHYPLLGALASRFTLIEDQLICHRQGISVAAIDCEAREIYINPASGLNSPAFREECRFVMAHELLHAGLRHDVRCQGRDPYLWNVACDYVINGWLIEMQVGEPPAFGLLHDPTLKGESAEAIYDRIVTDMRRFRRLATLRGVGLGDILEPRHAEWWTNGPGVDLDDFYRRSISQGLVYHQEQGRGLLPAGLIEEIRALSQPPIPWDVQLAQWFDNHFPLQERVRTYARASRRQSATPDIARPLWVPPPPTETGRTFGVVLDTSGSMDNKLLGKALGAIASYSMARDVPAVRVVFCDAEAYDQGYMPPENIASSVKIRGRGGTVLQPGIDLLEEAKNFPPGGPLLIITDGYCDRLRVHREHAFLLPAGRNLPFIPKGPVFRVT
ncbi:MAG TPA: VWA-like domain-containing protein [Ktedonobacteraceae bacterium]|nr:VWA-like domain-containing protein [Ktedonobacteraceae bacterium]